MKIDIHSYNYLKGSLGSYISFRRYVSRKSNKVVSRDYRFDLVAYTIKAIVKWHYLIRENKCASLKVSLFNHHPLSYEKV